MDRPAAARPVCPGGSPRDTRAPAARTSGRTARRGWSWSPRLPDQPADGCAGQLLRSPARAEVRLRPEHVIQRTDQARDGGVVGPALAGYLHDPVEHLRAGGAVVQVDLVAVLLADSHAQLARAGLQSPRPPVARLVRLGQELG